MRPAAHNGHNGGTAPLPAARNAATPGNGAAPSVPLHAYVYDPLGHVRAERYRLARQWQEAGAVYQAIAARAEMLTRYAGTPTAAAAAEDLLEMVTLVEQEGMFYTALDVLQKVERSC